MLLRTLFVLVFTAALVETEMAGSHALAQLSLRRQAALAARQQIAASTTAAREALAAALASGDDPQAPQPSMPPASPSCALASDSGCAIEVIGGVTYASSPAGGAYEQGNDAVDEGRLSAQIDARAIAPGGAVLAERTARVTFRTFAVPPFAALAGSEDASTQAAETGPGDDAGAAPNGAAPGTLIDVLYENRQTGARMPGNVWRSATPGPAITPGSWSP